MEGSREARWLLIDTETTGLPRIQPRAPFGTFPDVRDVSAYSGARVLQVAWMLCDGDSLEKVSELSSFVYPDPDVAFSAEAERVNGISMEKALARGRPFADIADALEEIVAGPATVTLVAHNAAFDKCVLASELHRRGRGQLGDLLMAMPTLCTMERSKEAMNLRCGARKQFVKNPKLGELHRWATGCDVAANLHDARGDVDALYDIVCSLRRDRPGVVVPGPGVTPRDASGV